MGKLHYINIAGKDYPMSFSLGACKKLQQKYGSNNEINEKVTELKNDKKIDELLEILELLITQGCAFKNAFEKDLPAPENAPVVNGRWEAMPKELMEIAISAEDTEYVSEVIQEAMNISSKKEVTATEKEKKEEATQE